MLNTFSEVVQHLESLGVMPDRPPALDQVKKGLICLGYESYPFFKRYQEDPRRVFLVAGTNGKGSVCSTLETLLSSQGERTGLYTSPDLISPTERIRIGAKDVSQSLFCEAFHAVREKVGDLRLTHFEMLTLMAIWSFCSGETESPVDRVILEVGLGGLWDATNAVPHGLSVISKIGFDHEHILGSTLPEIARNKFGIVSPASHTVVHGVFDSQLDSLVEETQKKTNSTWVQTPPWGVRFEGGKTFLQSPWGEAELALMGRRGAENSMLALTAFEQMGFDPSKGLAALKQVPLRGRMEKVEETPSGAAVYFSGDHNAQGVQSLCEILQHMEWKQLHVLAGVGAKKNLDEILGPLHTLPRSRLYLTRTPFKGMEMSEYGAWLDCSSGAWDDIHEAYSEVKIRAKEGDLVVVTGSLYLVGDLMKAMAATRES